MHSLNFIASPIRFALKMRCGRPLWN